MRRPAQSFAFARCVNDVEDRLDVNYNDVDYDDVWQRLESALFRSVRLDELATFARDLTDPLKKPDKEFWYLDIGGIDTQTGEPRPVCMLGKDATSARMRRVMRAGDVLVSTTRPERGAICVVPPQLDHQVCSTGLATLRPKPGVSAELLARLLRCEFALRQMGRLCSGSGYPAINGEVDLPTVRIPFPEDPADQSALLDILRPVEIEAKRLSQHAQFQHDRALHQFAEALGAAPPAEGYAFRESERNFDSYIRRLDGLERLDFFGCRPLPLEFSQLEKKIPMISLGMACQPGEPVRRGEQPPEYLNADDSVEESVLVIKTENVMNGWIDFDAASMAPMGLASAHPSAVLRQDDLLVTSTGFGSMGRIAVVPMDIPLAVADGHISIIRLRPPHNPKFVALFLASPFGQHQIDRLFSGSSGQIELQPKDIESIKIPDAQASPQIAATLSTAAQSVTPQLDAARADKKKASDTWIAVRRRLEELVLG